MEGDRWQKRIVRREIYRYMGMKEQAADEALQAQVNEQLKRLLSVCRVRSFYQVFPLCVLEAGEARTASGPEERAGEDTHRNE